MAKIKEVRCIRSRATGTWGFVKVITDQPGLYGIGSISDHYHSSTVFAAIESMIGPKLNFRILRICAPAPEMLRRCWAVPVIGLAR